jgi:hypothetical protein
MGDDHSFVDRVSGVYESHHPTTIRTAQLMDSVCRSNTSLSSRMLSYRANGLIDFDFDFDFFWMQCTYIDRL